MRASSLLGVATFLASWYSLSPSQWGLTLLRPSARRLCSRNQTVCMASRPEGRVGYWLVCRTVRPVRTRNCQASKDSQASLTQLFIGPDVSGQEAADVRVPWVPAAVYRVAGVGGEEWLAVVVGEAFPEGEGIERGTRGDGLP